MFSLIFIGIIFSLSLVGGGIYYATLNTSTKLITPFGKLIIQIALGIIVAILGSILIVLKPIIQVTITVLQNIIYILTIYPFLQFLFKINPFWMVITFGSLFLILLFFFFTLSWFQKIHSEKQENFKWLNIIKAMIIFLLAPIILILIMSFIQMLVLNIFDKDIFSISFYKIIETITLKNDSITLSNLETNQITITFFKIILFLLCSFFSIWFLTKFAYNLTLRFFELIWFGAIGITISSSSLLIDEGERFYMWTYIMIQKIIVPIIGILSYLFFLMIMKPIVVFLINLNSSFFVLGFEWETKTILAILFIIMGTALMESLMSEWTFIISAKNGRSAFATQMNAGNFITRPLNKGINLLKNTTNLISFESIEPDLLDSNTNHSLNINDIEHNNHLGKENEIQ